MIPNIAFGIYSRIVVIILELKGQKYIENGKGGRIWDFSPMVTWYKGWHTLVILRVTGDDWI